MRILRPAAPRRVAQIVVSPASASLNVGEQQPFTATAFDQDGVEYDGQTFTWSATDDALSVDSGTGVATGISIGSGTVVASIGSVQGSALVDVSGSWLSQLDLDLGGDGAGSVLRAAFPIREFTRNAQDQIIAGGSSFGLGAPMTILGTPEYDPVLQTLVTLEGSTPPHDNLETAVLPEIDAAGPITLVAIGISSPVSNSFFRCRLRTASNAISLQIFRSFAGTNGDQIVLGAGTAGSTIVNTGVDNSATMRVMFAQKDDSTTVTACVPNADPVTGAITAYASEGMKLGILAENPSTGQPNKTLACVLIITKNLSAAEREIVTVAGEAQFPDAERAPAPAGTAVDHVLLTPAALTLTLGNTYQVVGVARDATNTVLPSEGINYSGNNNSVALVSALGVITPVGAGTLTVTATSASDPTKTDTCAVTIEAAVATSVDVAPPALTVPLAQTRSAQITVRDQSEADGVPIGFVMTSGYTVQESSSNTGIATVVEDSITQITVSSVAVGTATVTVQINGNPAIADTVAVTVPASAVAGVYHVADESWFGDYADRRLSAQLPLTTGTDKTFFWHCQQHPMRAVGAAPGAFRAIHGQISHFAGKQCSFIGTIPIAYLDGSNLPAMQCTLRFAARVSNAQASLKIAPVLVVQHPHTRAVIGYLYDPPYVAPGGLGNAFSVHGSNLVGRVVSFNTNALSGIPFGALLSIELFAVGTATYTGLGTPRGNSASGQTGASIITDGWTPSTLVMRAGDAWQPTADESFRPDWRLASDATSDAGGNATLAMADSVATALPDNAQIYPMWSFGIGVGGSTTCVEGVTNADPSFEVEFDQALPQPAAGTVAHIRVPARDTVWMYVGGPTFDASDVEVLDRDGNDVSAAHSPGFASNDTNVCTAHSSTGVVTVVGAGYTTITVTAGGRTRAFGVQVMASEYGPTLLPHFRARSFDSIATTTQPSPDLDTRVAPNGSDGWDNTEKTSFNGTGRGLTRVTPSGVLGFGGGSGIVDPSGHADANQRQEAFHAMLMARRAPYISNDVRSIHRSHFKGYMNGTSPGTQQTLQSGSGEIPAQNWNEIEYIQFLYFDENGAHHPTIQKVDYLWFANPRPGNPGKVGNYINGFVSQNGGVVSMQQTDHFSTPWRFQLRGQGHPENSSNHDPGAQFRDNYNCTVAGEGFIPVGQWFKTRLYAHGGSGPGADNGIIRWSMDTGDGRGEVLCMEHTDVRFQFSDSSSFKWNYIQRIAVFGGGVPVNIRRPFSLFGDHFEIRGQ